MTRSRYHQSKLGGRRVTVERSASGVGGQSRPNPPSGGCLLYLSVRMIDVEPY
jgi:hypothetical protein|eukprot:COSAG01_NODE_5765_length_4043_cov_3.138804_5_plen_53_part_00